MLSILNSYIVHCCLILRVLSSKNGIPLSIFMTLRIKDMRLSSIVLLIAHQNRILTKQLVSICTNYYISGLGAFNRPLPVQVMLVPFCASFTLFGAITGYIIMIRVALLNKKIGMNTTINFDLETFPVDAVDVVHGDTWGFWANRNSLYHGPT